MFSPMPTFVAYINGEFQDYIAAVSLRQAQQRARKRYGRRVDVIGDICGAERLSTQSSFSIVGPALVASR